MKLEVGDLWKWTSTNNMWAIIKIIKLNNNYVYCKIIETFNVPDWVERAKCNNEIIIWVYTKNDEWNIAHASNAQLLSRENSIKSKCIYRQLQDAFEAP